MGRGRAALWAAQRSAGRSSWWSGGETVGGSTAEGRDAQNVPGIFDLRSKAVAVGFPRSTATARCALAGAPRCNEHERRAASWRPTCSARARLSATTSSPAPRDMGALVHPARRRRRRTPHVYAAALPPLVEWDDGLPHTQNPSRRVEDPRTRLALPPTAPYVCMYASPCQPSLLLSPGCGMHGTGSLPARGSCDSCDSCPGRRSQSTHTHTHTLHSTHACTATSHTDSATRYRCRIALQPTRAAAVATWIQSQR